MKTWISEHYGSDTSMVWNLLEHLVLRKRKSLRNKIKQKREYIENHILKDIIKHRKKVNHIESPNIKNTRKKDNVCWKCDRPGYYANSCKVAKKINQIEDEELKKNLLNILINSESEEIDNTSEEEESEIEVEQIESDNSTEYSKESEEDYCLGPGLCNCENCISDKNINMLNKDQTNTLISIIDKLEDSPLKDEFLSQLNQLTIKSEEVWEQIEPINMKDIYKRFKVPNQNITIKDLQEEIKILNRKYNY